MRTYEEMLKDILNINAPTDQEKLRLEMELDLRDSVIAKNRAIISWFARNKLVDANSNPRSEKNRPGGY